MHEVDAATARVEKSMYDIHHKIAHYIDFLGDYAYIESIISTAHVEAIFDIIADILDSRRREDINNTLAFVRDVVLLAPANIRQEFKQKIYTSIVIDALNAAVFADDYAIRSGAIFTLGKIGSRDSLDVFHQAFTASKRPTPSQSSL